MTETRKLPSPPPEPPACRDVTVLAPAFQRKLADVMIAMTEKGWRPIVRETYRSNERQIWLHGFGRLWDDGRGVVTNVSTALAGWHFFKLAADVGDRRYDDEHTPAQFWKDLEACVMAAGLTSGADWNRNGVHDETFVDRPHVQWWCPGMNVSPSAHAAELFASGGVEAVWRVLHADVEAAPTTAPTPSAPSASPSVPASRDTATIASDATSQDHAGVLHSIFSALEKVVHAVEDPRVIALLPEKYRTYATAVAVAERLLGRSDPAASPSATMR